VALPPLPLLAPRLISPWEIKVRAVGHDAFDATETFFEMQRLGLTAQHFLTPAQALELLGTDPEQTDDVVCLGGAVCLLDEG
jgi:hypothetical protein